MNITTKRCGGRREVDVQIGLYMYLKVCCSLRFPVNVGNNKITIKSQPFPKAYKVGKISVKSKGFVACQSLALNIITLIKSEQRQTFYRYEKETL